MPEVTLDFLARQIERVLDPAMSLLGLSEMRRPKAAAAATLHPRPPIEWKWMA
jgi:hypothetical protein